MDPVALAGLCALLARGDLSQTLPAGVTCPPPVIAAPPVLGAPAKAYLAARALSPDARDGIARVAYAEAANQGDSGLAAVVYTILNRLRDGRWGDTVDRVLNARAQFEPVMRAGGDWRALPAVSAAAQARIDTILNLALEGRLPDLTGGARFFQNPTIVAGRARAGTVSPSLVHFGGAAPSAVIGAHSFYVEPGRGGRSSSRAAATPAVRPAGSRDVAVFVGENRAARSSEDQTAEPPPAAMQALSGDPSRALFVGRDGRVSADPF